VFQKDVLDGMTKEEKLYHEAAQKNKDAEESQMFGKPCYKINGKAFVCFFENSMVFKLKGDAHAGALETTGAKLFDPSGKGRAMREWVQIPGSSSEEWPKLAKAAYEYVKAAAK
jgi:hypothetical protein